MYVISNENTRIPIKCWSRPIEPGAWDQAMNLSTLPFAFHHVALMPDVHQGYGMPIGGVLATKEVIIPNAVGVDIGCGVLAVETDLEIESCDHIVEAMRHAYATIPLGFAHHETPRMPWMSVRVPDVLVTGREYQRSLYQLGTLGGGNHFIEADVSMQTGRVWFVIHSGSRNLGKQVADHYGQQAIELNEKYYTQVPKSSQLAFLPLESQTGKLYFEDMQMCLLFAEKNRAEMMSKLLEIIGEVAPHSVLSLTDVHHNYARKENHYRKNVMVHRKGAVAARNGDRIVIPGNMGVGTAIGCGLGSSDSFHSASHGAGRRMGRRAAKENFSTNDMRKQMPGVLLLANNAGETDEAPGAYKDFDTVLKEEEDLVEIVDRLYPLVVIKG
jgi:tRNA-splicing ligase RtcB (3'-phosphate/5'-hydroxy nucleic acid ligase)